MGFLASAFPFLSKAAPYALSFLANRIGSGAQYGHMTNLRNQLMQLLSPEALTNESNSLFNNLKSSPIYSSLRTQAMNNATSLSNRLTESYGRRGLSTSGIAGIAQPLAASSYGNDFMNIDAGLFSKALGEARQNLSARAAALTGTQVPGIGAGTWGGFSQDILPHLYDLLSKWRGGTTPSSPTMAGPSQSNWGSNPSPWYTPAHM